jgi:hypothetical protein
MDDFGVARAGNGRSFQHQLTIVNKKMREKPEIAARNMENKRRNRVKT